MSGREGDNPSLGELLLWARTSIALRRVVTFSSNYVVPNEGPPLHLKGTLKVMSMEASTIICKFHYLHGRDFCCKV